MVDDALTHARWQLLWLLRLRHEATELWGTPLRRAEVELLAPEEGVSPGQACVFYATKGTRVLGGGWIARDIGSDRGVAHVPHNLRAQRPTAAASA